MTDHSSLGSRLARPFVVLISLIATAFLVASCSSSDSSSSSSDETAGSESSNERVVSLGFGDADTLLALGIKPVLVAQWGEESEAASNGAKGVGPWATDLFGDEEPEVLHGTGQGIPDGALEKIAAAKPTRIIAVNAAIDEKAKAALEKIAPVTLHPEAYSDWQVPWDVQVETISAAVDKADEGKKLIDDTNQTLADFREAHPEIQGKKAIAAMPYDGQLGAYTANDGRGAFLRSIGYEIPEVVDANAEGGFSAAFSAENYNKLDAADVLVILDYADAVKALKEEAPFKNLSLVKENHVVFFEQNIGNAMSMPNPVTIPWVLEQTSNKIMEATK